MISSKISRPGNDEDCPKCGGPTSWRQEHPYPVLIHSIFGLSFLLFLVFFDRVKRATWKLPFHFPVHFPGQAVGGPHSRESALIWVWCLVQALLGALLIRGRLRAKRRILRCIRCSADLR